MSQLGIIINSAFITGIICVLVEIVKEFKKLRDNDQEE